MIFAVYTTHYTQTALHKSVQERFWEFAFGKGNAHEANLTENLTEYTLGIIARRRNAF